MTLQIFFSNFDFSETLMGEHLTQRLHGTEMEHLGQRLRRMEIERSGLTKQLQPLP